jgi:hypothetical protein
MDDVQIDILRTQIERQERKQREQMLANPTVVERLREMYGENFQEEFSKHAEQQIRESAARTLPFAIQISEENNVVGELSEEQFGEAEIRSARKHLQNVTRQFEDRINNATHLSERRRKFAVDLIAMHKKHEVELSEATLDPEKRSEESLQRIADSIAADLLELNRRYHGDTPNETTD